MTLVQLDYDLLAPLDDKLTDRIARLHGVYGIHHVSVTPALDGITVEYDATHVAEFEVNSILAKAGLPVRLKRHAVPPATDGPMP